MPIDLTNSGRTRTSAETRPTFAVPRRLMGVACVSAGIAFLAVGALMMFRSI